MSLASLRPHDVRFSQDSISSRFTNNSYLTSTFHDLLTRKLTPFDIQPIEVVQIGGLWWALTGNRRLYLYRKLEELGVIKNIPVICKSVNDNQVQRQLNFRMTTVTNGKTIECRQPQAQAIIRSMIEEWKKQQNDERAMTTMCDSLSSTLTLNARQGINYNNTSFSKENYGTLQNRNLLKDQETARITSARRREFSKGFNDQLTTRTYSTTSESPKGHAYTHVWDPYRSSGESLQSYSSDTNSEVSAYSQPLNSRSKSNGYKFATTPQLNNFPAFRESWEGYDRPMQSTTYSFPKELGLRKQPTYWTNFRSTAKPVTYNSSFDTPHAYSTKTGETQRSSTNNATHRESWDVYYNPKERYITSRYKEYLDGYAYANENLYSVKSTSYRDCFKKDYDDCEDASSAVFEITDRKTKDSSRLLYPKPRISELHPNALLYDDYFPDSSKSLNIYDYI